MVRAKSKEPQKSGRQGKDDTASDSDNVQISEFKPTSMFNLMGEKAIGQKRAEADDVLNDDDIRKLDRL